MNKIKKRNFQIYIPIISVLILCIFFLIYVCLPKPEKEKNVTFFISNTLNDKVSCIVKLNDSIIVKTRDMKKILHNPALALKDGSYIIEVSTLENNLNIKKNFRIINAQDKFIYIHFSKFSLDEFLPIYKKRFFENFIKKKNFTEEEKIGIWKQIDQGFTNEFLINKGYVEQKPTFEIRVLDDRPLTD